MVSTLIAASSVSNVNIKPLVLGMQFTNRRIQRGFYICHTMDDIRENIRFRKPANELSAGLLNSNSIGKDRNLFLQTTFAGPKV
jgi:hypothetical protein